MGRLYLASGRGALADGLKIWNAALASSPPPPWRCRDKHAVEHADQLIKLVVHRRVVRKL
jgi:hypothetical protein